MNSPSFSALVLGNSERATWIAERLNCPNHAELPNHFDGFLIVADFALNTYTFEQVIEIKGENEILDASNTWFLHVAARAHSARNWALADGIWVEMGASQGFALCCGATHPNTQKALTPVLDRLAPVAGAWLPLNTAYEASFAALLLNVLHHLALQGVLHMPAWQELALPFRESATHDPRFEKIKHVFAEHLELAQHLRTVCAQFLSLSSETDSAFIAWVRWLEMALNSLEEAKNHLNSIA